MRLPTAPQVAVIGGGSAGLAAALASARTGAETVLIERHSQLGGMGTNAFVHTFCGLYHPDTSAGPRWLNQGIPTEIGERMLEATGQTGPELMGRVYVLRQHPSHFARIADDLCRAEPSLTLAADTEMVSIQQGEGCWKMELLCRGKTIHLTPRALVDTSGDAAVAHALRSPRQETMDSARLFRPAFVSLFHGLSSQLDETLRLQIAGQIVKAVRRGELPTVLLGASFRQSTYAGEAFLTIDLEAGGAEWDPQNPACRAAVVAEGRAATLALWEHLRAVQDVFAGCPPPVFPPQPGVRESTRWQGDYVLTAEDLVTSRRFGDEVALAGWPLEMRENARGPKLRYFDKTEPAGIPAGCLSSAMHPGIWFAGRCISATHEALASVRVMGTCMATGQAAGTLAARW